MQSNQQTEQFKQTVLPHTPAMLRILKLTLGDEEAARDVLQEVLTRLWESRQKLSGVDNIRAYCLKSARNLALNHLERSRRFESIEQCREIEDAANPALTAELSSATALIDCLPVQQQTVLRMRTFADMEVDEISDSLGISQANVRQLLSRARRKLRELYNK